MTKKRSRSIWAFPCFAVLVLLSPARADSIAVTTPFSITTDTEQVLIGFKFTPTEDIYVTALGVWDGQTPGLAYPNEVGVYDAAGNLMFSTTVQAGTVNPLVNDYRYASISYQLLTHGLEYQIFSIALGPDEYYGGFNPGLDGITLTSGGIYSYAPTSLPSVLPSLSDYGYDVYGGPNFQFTPVPEPSSVVLLSGALMTGFAGLVARRRRMAH